MAYVIRQSLAAWPFDPPPDNPLEVFRPPTPEQMKEALHRADVEAGEAAAHLPGGGPGGGGGGSAAPPAGGPGPGGGGGGGGAKADGSLIPGVPNVALAAGAVAVVAYVMMKRKGA